MGRLRRRLPKVEWDWANALVKSTRMSATRRDEEWDKALTPEVVRRLWSLQGGRCQFNRHIALVLPLKVDPRTSLRNAVIAEGNADRLDNTPMLVRTVNTGVWRVGGVCLASYGMLAMMRMSGWDVVRMRQMCLDISKAENSIIATRDQLLSPEPLKELPIKCDHTPTCLLTEAVQQQPK